MLSHLHDHIVEELKTTTKTDTIFVVTALAFNLVLLATNSIIAVSEGYYFIMFIFAALTVTVSIITEIGLIKGRQTRTKLTEGLIEIYKDNGIDKYYDRALLETHKSRYNLFMICILALSVVALVVPFLLI